MPSTIGKNQRTAQPHQALVPCSPRAAVLLACQCVSRVDSLETDVPMLPVPFDSDAIYGPS
jgi:hypothetical protein